MTSAVTVAAGCSGNNHGFSPVLNPSPAVSIKNPKSGSSFGIDEAIDFFGIVVDFDEEDGISSMFWSSSIDNELANIDSASPDEDGFTQFSATLSSGEHIITLSVTDVGGGFAEDHIDLLVR